jgi:hypothetical protein
MKKTEIGAVLNYSLYQSATSSIEVCIIKPASLALAFLDSLEVTRQVFGGAKWTDHATLRRSMKFRDSGRGTYIQLTISVYSGSFFKKRGLRDKPRTDVTLLFCLRLTSDPLVVCGTCMYRTRRERDLALARWADASQEPSSVVRFTNPAMFDTLSGSIRRGSLRDSLRRKPASAAEVASVSVIEQPPKPVFSLHPLADDNEKSQATINLESKGAAKFSARARWDSLRRKLLRPINLFT